MSAALIAVWPMLWRGLAAAAALGLFALVLVSAGKADGFAKDAADDGEGREPVKP